MKGSRFLLVKQLKKVIRDTIPRLENKEQADKLFSQVSTLFAYGLLTESEYKDYSDAIIEICNLQGWTVTRE